MKDKRLETIRLWHKACELAKYAFNRTLVEIERSVVFDFQNYRNSLIRDLSIYDCLVGKTVAEAREILDGTGIEILPVVIDGRSCTTPADIDDRVQVEIAGDRIIRIDGLG